MMKLPKNIHNRDIYVARVKPFMNKQLIKVLTGQRRVGKSYLLFQLMKEVKKKDKTANIIYINKEELEFDFIRDATDLNNYVLSQSVKKSVNYIFIDEIQDIADFEKALRSLLLNAKNDIYITGSNANLLSGELATYLSARYVEFPVYSLSYPEFLKFHKLTDTDENLMQYMTYGGLPYLINMELNTQVFGYLKSVCDTIIFRDVVNRYKIRNTAFLNKLVLFLANNVGSLFSAKSISDFLKSQRTKIETNQVLVYLDYLASAFLVHRVQRYDIKGKRQFEIGEKYYFENLGIRNAMVGFRLTDRSHLLENLVYNHLLYLGWTVKVGVVDGQEIDFVCEKAGEKMYIQVALQLDSEKTIEREFGNLLKIKNNYPKMVVSYDTLNSRNTYEGIKHIHVREFLKMKE